MPATTRGRLLVTWKLPSTPPSSTLVAAVSTAVQSEIPAAILDRWNDLEIPAVDTQGNADVEAVGTFVQDELKSLNEARHGTQEDPPDFSLSSPSPFECWYDYVDNVRVCYYYYTLSLGGEPWTVTAAKSSQSATLNLKISWEGALA